MCKNLHFNSVIIILCSTAVAPISAANMFQGLQQMPETVDSSEPYIVSFFVYIRTLKFN